MIPQIFLEGAFLTLLIFTCFQLWEIIRYFLVGIIFASYLIDKKKLTKKSIKEMN